MKKISYTLITGAAGLLGKYHAIGILNLKQNLVLTDTDLVSLKKTQIFLKKKFPSSKILLKKLDVTSEKSIKKLLNYLRTKNIVIKVLINNAAIDAKFSSKKTTNRLENFSLKQWNKEINVGLSGAFLCSKYFGNAMAKENKGGIILNIASDLSIIAPNQNIYKLKNTILKNQPVKPVTYSVVKHGLIGLTKYLSTYWPNSNIRCNALSPGPILDIQSRSLINKLKKLIPMNRLANKDEYISAIEFLCSNKSSYMTGHNLIIDGGRSAW